MYQKYVLDINAKKEQRFKNKTKMIGTVGRIAGGWKAMALKAEVRVDTVTEGRRGFMAA